MEVPGSSVQFEEGYGYGSYARLTRRKGKGKGWRRRQTLKSRNCFGVMWLPTTLIKVWTDGDQIILYKIHFFIFLCIPFHLRKSYLWIRLIQVGIHNSFSVVKIILLRHVATRCIKNPSFWYRVLIINLHAIQFSKAL